MEMTDLDTFSFGQVKFHMARFQCRFFKVKTVDQRSRKNQFNSSKQAPRVAKGWI